MSRLTDSEKQASPVLEAGKEALPDSTPDPQDEYPPWAKVLVIISALYMSMFVVALVCIIFFGKERIE
jgi:hypothetical protein